MLNQTIACNVRQFGNTCSLPLGANCPWRNQINVSQIYTLQKPKKNTYCDSNYEQINIIKINSKPSNFRSSICQVIFPFPLQTWKSLNSSLSAKDYNNIILRLPDPTKTGIVKDIQLVKATATIADVGVRTYVGKVANSYGYYIYSSPNRIEWKSKIQLCIPKIIFNRMLRLKKNTIEYSFYGSEDYCKIQTLILK